MPSQSYGDNSEVKYRSEEAEKFARAGLEQHRGQKKSEALANLSDKFFNKKAHMASIQRRGTAFIEAAKLLVENHYIFTEDRAKKDRMLNQLASIQQAWEKLGEKGQLKNIKALYDLNRLLCERISETVYENRKKPEEVLSELAHAENHYNWRSAGKVGSREQIASVLELDDQRVQVRVDIPIARFTKKQEEDWEDILAEHPNGRPKWFNSLPEWEQNYFKAKVGQWQKQSPRPNLGDFLGTPPTTIRGYPGARNGYHSYVFNYRAKDDGSYELENSFYKIRSGHISPSEMKNSVERLQAAKDNIKQLILEGVREKVERGEKDILVNLQTLITPPFKEDDRIMDQDRMEAIQDLRREFSGSRFANFLKENGVVISGDAPSITLITSNHPINAGRAAGNIGFITSPRRYKENQTTLQAIKRKAAKLTGGSEKKMAEEALANLNKISGLKRIANFFVRGINHNTERAALEQIAISAVGGLRLGSCMSGKDREGAVSEHAAAMVGFYQKYNRFPPIPGVWKMFLSKKERDLRNEYEMMVAKEFLAGHDQRIAEANAAGASGLKEVSTTLGSNVLKKADDIFSQKVEPKTALEKPKEKPELAEITNKIAKSNRIKKKKIKKTKRKKIKKANKDESNISGGEVYAQLAGALLVQSQTEQQRPPQKSVTEASLEGARLLFNAHSSSSPKLSELIEGPSHLRTLGEENPTMPQLEKEEPPSSPKKDPRNTGRQLG